MRMCLSPLKKVRIEFLPSARTVSAFRTVEISELKSPTSKPECKTNQRNWGGKTQHSEFAKGTGGEEHAAQERRGAEVGHHRSVPVAAKPRPELAEPAEVRHLPRAYRRGQHPLARGQGQALDHDHAEVVR